MEVPSERPDVPVAVRLPSRELRVLRGRESTEALPMKSTNEGGGVRRKHDAREQEAKGRCARLELLRVLLQVRVPQFDVAEVSCVAVRRSREALQLSGAESSDWLVACGRRRAPQQGRNGTRFRPHRSICAARGPGS